MNEVFGAGLILIFCCTLVVMWMKAGDDDDA